jgi:hypothetical protein
MKRLLIRRLAWIALALFVLLVAVPFLPLDLLRPRIERALEQGLGRKVEVGGVHFTLLPGVLPGPGFTLDAVTIHEDPRAGIEPFAYVDSLSATVRLGSFFTRRLEFSSLNLGDATINLVKTGEGPWNFQYLLAGASNNPHAMPSIRMRGGRVNFKFGYTKSYFYFNDADLDVAPYADGSVVLRFEGAPSRTDLAAQEFGRLFVRGNASPGSQQLNFSVELEKSSLQEAARWMAPGGSSVQGSVALQAQLSGPPSRMAVLGNLQLDGVHRGDVPAAQGGSWRLPFTGILDLADERLNLAGPQDSQLAVRLHAANWLSALEWDVAANVREVSLDTILKIARSMGATYPEQVAAEGKVSGSLIFNGGLSGVLALEEASLTLPGAAPLRASEATVNIAQGTVRLGRTVVQAGESQSAEVEGSYSLSEPRELDVKVTTRGLNVADMRSFAMAAIPVLRETSKGLWRGWARYRADKWSGEFELRDASIHVEGIAEPVTIDSAAVSLNGERVAVTRMQAHAGELAFSGSYRWEPAAKRPHKFALVIPEADAAGFEALLAPTLPRPGGFLSRTLRLGSPAPAPPWLEGRHAEGTVSISLLTAGDAKARDASARIEWDGAKVRLAKLAARLDPGSISGDVEIDLAGVEPRFHFDGKLVDFAYRGGTLDLEGTLDASDGIRGEGKLRGRAISFAPDAEFRTVAATFEVQGAGAQARWKLTSVEVNQGGELFTGSGSTQSDGKLLLDLASRGRPLRVSALLFAPPAQP